MTKFSWTCPYCNRGATIQSANYSSSSHTFDKDNKDGQLTLVTEVTTCPDEKCREYVINASLWRTKYSGGVLSYLGSDPVQTWRLKPNSLAKVFPDYIPQVIREDYQEACKIRDLSPKASATLSRRCLQGMIRAFWKVKGKTLKAEIDKLKGKVDSDTWDAIDAVRQVGNIGAHMEKNIDVIVDVEPTEAELLIGLIELLLEEWYIADHERKAHVAAVVKLAKTKKEQKGGARKLQPEDQAQHVIENAEASEEAEGEPKLLR
jgi:hypothetical protein